MFFNAVKEGDTVIFASDDEQDRILWVQAMYRATGQAYFLPRLSIINKIFKKDFHSFSDCSWPVSIFF